MKRSFAIKRAPASPVASTGELRAGAGVRDITPALGAPLSGYGSIRSEAATRMCGRLFAAALVLDDGQGERVALVSVDLHAGTRYLAELAAARLASSTGIGIGRLYLAATHTHCGPGHLYGNTLYDGMTAAERGLDEAEAEAIAEGIVGAVTDAVHALRPARLGLGAALAWGYSMNRSVDAFRFDGASPAGFARRFGAPPPGLGDENLAVDPRVSMLWAESLDGEPIGAFGTFGVHATAIAARHATLSSDVFGWAVHAAQDLLVESGVARARVPIALAAGAMGDVDLDLMGIGAHAMVERQGTETAGQIGRALGEAMVAAIVDARGRLCREVTLRPLFDEPSPAAAELEDGRSLAKQAAYGVPALAGSELGRNFMLDPMKLSTALSLEGRRGAYEPHDPHAPKLTTFRGLVARITGAAAPVLPLRLVDIRAGDERIVLAGLPGEPTVRFAAGIERMLLDRGASRVLVTAVTGDYAGYFTTEKEYEKQHYEGACTIWGRASFGFVSERLRRLLDAGSAPLEPEARFEQDASYPPERSDEEPPASMWPAAPALDRDGPDLYGRWTTRRDVVPRFGPDAWIAIEEERDGTWQPLTWRGAPVTDQTREILVERVAQGSHAKWHFRWRLPPELRHGLVRFALLPAAFGGPVVSNAVLLDDTETDEVERPSRPPVIDFADDFQHPSTEAELVALVRLAVERRASIRVRGSGHSVAPAIYTDALLEGKPGAVDVMLDRYKRISFDDAHMRVTVEAGCNLGVDPRDPTGGSRWENSLLAALEARGWALPDLGGVTHQTVSGFLMTGSSGGSLTHAIEDAVVAIRIIDGLGNVHDIERGRDERFDAVVCSMGLCGIVSRITFQCVPRYDVIGREDITPADATAFGLFDGEPHGLAAFLKRTEYARLMWWPQRGVDRVVTWQARRMVDSDYDDETGPRGALRPWQYSAFGDLPEGRFSKPASDAVQWAGGKFYDALDSASQARRAFEARLPFAAPLGRAASGLFEAHVLPTVLKQFVPVDTDGPQRFWDRWCDGLPMDNQMSDASLPTTFTEIFLPIEHTARAMRLLRNHFRAGGLDATGTFIFEIYAAKRTRGWLHPAHERDSIRIDVFWFERSSGDPIAFFEQFWDLFAPLGYRLHWGKHLPRDAGRGARYLRRQFPRWDDFLALRAVLDPHDIFLNDHFRDALGIDAAREAASTEPHGGDAPAGIPALGPPVPRFSLPPPDSRRAPLEANRSGSVARRLRTFYEDLAVRREQGLDRLEEVFSPDVAFKDPFRDTRGMPAFRELFERMFRQYREVRFTDFVLAGDDDAFTMTYDMHLRMAVGPSFVTPMCSVVTARHGKVVRLVDYYDFGSGLVSPANTAVRAYQWLANKLFL